MSIRKLTKKKSSKKVKSKTNSKPRKNSKSKTKRKSKVSRKSKKSRKSTKGRKSKKGGKLSIKRKSKKGGKLSIKRKSKKGRKSKGGTSDLLIKLDKSTRTILETKKESLNARIFPGDLKISIFGHVGNYSKQLGRVNQNNSEKLEFKTDFTKTDPNNPGKGITEDILDVEVQLLKIPEPDESTTKYNILILILNIIGLFTFIRIANENYIESSRKDLLKLHIHFFNNRPTTLDAARDLYEYYTNETNFPLFFLDIDPKPDPKLPDDKVKAKDIANAKVKAEQIKPLLDTYLADPSNDNLTKILTIANNNELDLFDKQKKYSKTKPWYQFW